MNFGYQTFTYPVEYGEVTINFNKKDAVARVLDSGDEGERLLRELLAENDWQVKAVAVSAKADSWPVYLIRGEPLLSYLKEPGTHNDTALSLLTKNEQAAIRKTRERRLTDDTAIGQTVGVYDMPRQGAGVLAFCVTTQRFLFGVRAPGVPMPGYVAMFGGKLEPGEEPRVGAARELAEEAGIEVSPEKLVPLTVIRENNGLIFHSFLLLVTEEFTCTLNPDEISNCGWIAYQDFPRYKMHHGVLKLFAEDAILKRFVTSNLPGTNYAQIVDDIFGSTKLPTNLPVADETPDDPGPAPLIA